MPERGPLPPDHELVERCRKGDPAAFDVLVERYQRRVMGLCMRHLRSWEEAADLVDIEGLSYEQAAKVLEIPVNTVRSRLSRAREQLKQKLVRLRKRLGE